MTTALSSIGAIPLTHVRRGKVREVYAVDDARLLIVATDRVSAFDVVMNEPVPHKGAVLTQITAWWLRHFEKDVRHHMIANDIGEIVRLVPVLEPHRGELAGRAMLCRRTEVFPVECVVRGYLSGSAWKEYRESGTLAGERLPAGMVESARFEAPIFSPATKAETGHDENITRDDMAQRIGREQARELERLSLHVYGLGRDIAQARGIIIADTKFEFGTVDGKLILIDEVMTPDSSRFWPQSDYRPGISPPSFDKQYVRDYLTEIGWNKEPPAPQLPPDVVRRTSEKYLEALRRLTA